MSEKSARRIVGRCTVLIGGPVAVIVVVLAWGSIPQGPLVITAPPTDAEPGRWIHLEGAANTRDAGAYATRDGRVVKRGMVYRSGKLNRLTSAGADAYRELRVNTVIDFCNRLTPWPLFGGDVWSVQLASSVHGCPMSFSKDEPPEAFYIRGLRDNAQAFRRAFELLADHKNYPVLYHCRNGTDRTGVTTALLLTLLGVDRETVMADFRLSEQVGAPGNLEAMEKLLDEIQANGGIEAYLSAIGVSPEAQAAIRALLLD